MSQVAEDQPPPKQVDPFERKSYIERGIFPPMLCSDTNDTASLNERARCRYLRGAYIGHGAFGTVFTARRNPDFKGDISEYPSRVREDTAETNYVVKAIFLSHQEAERIRPLSEAALLSKCDSSFIVGHVEHRLVDNGKILIVITERCDCGDLQTLINNGRKMGQTFPSQWTGFLLAQLAAALYYMHHKKGMLHRDIKPRNIFTTSAQVLKLGDFGFTKSVTPVNKSDSLTRGAEDYHTICGTPEFFAPEMLDSSGQSVNTSKGGSSNASSGEKKLPATAPKPRRRKYGVKADMWALGLTLYEMTHGVSEGLGDRVDKIRAGTWESIPQGHDYKPELIAIIHELLSVDPSNRPSAIQILAKPYVQRTIDEFLVHWESLQNQNKLSLRDYERVKQELLAAKEAGRRIEEGERDAPLSTPEFSSAGPSVPSGPTPPAPALITYQTARLDEERQVTVYTLTPRKLVLVPSGILILDREDEVPLEGSCLPATASHTAWENMVTIQPYVDGSTFALTIWVDEFGIATETLTFLFLTREEMNLWDSALQPRLLQATQKRNAWESSV